MPRHRTVSRPELLVNGDDQAFRAFVHDLLGFAARLQAVRDGFGMLLGLSGPAYTCLVAIAFLQEKHRTGINGLARHLHLSPAFVTLEVAKLVALDLVRKTVDGHDRRRVLLSVTDKGSAALAALSQSQIPVNDSLFSSLGPADFRMLRRLLPKLIDASDQALLLLRSFPAPKRRKSPT